MGACAPSGQPFIGRIGRASVRGLAGAAWLGAGTVGNVCGNGPFYGRGLPRGQLAGNRTNHRTDSPGKAASSPGSTQECLGVSVGQAFSGTFGSPGQPRRCTMSQAQLPLVLEVF